MAIPAFVPLIGSSFDALGNQQLQWQGFNRGVEENNMARLQHAQDAQNNWLAQVANMQRQDAARQENLARQDQGDILSQLDRAQAFGERAREFDVGTGLEKSKLDQEAKARDWHLAIRDADEKRQMDTVENTAKFLAKDAQDYASAFKDSAQELRDATHSLDTSATRVESSPKIAFTRSKQFAPTLVNANDPDAIRAAAEANARLAADKSRYDQAVENYRLHLSNWNDLKKRAAQNGLDIGDDGTVYSPYHDKKYGSPIKLDTAIAPAKEEPSVTMPSWLNPTLPSELSNPWSGFAAMPVSAPVVAPSTPTIRRYNPATGRIE